MDETIRVYSPILTEQSGVLQTIRGKHLKPEEDLDDVIDEDWDQDHTIEVKREAEPDEIIEEMKEQERAERKRFIMEELVHYREPEQQPEPKKPWRKETYLESLQGVLEERRKKEADMNFRHPWFNLMYNWVIVVLVVALFASFWWWGARIRKDNREASIRATAYAEFQAEQDAKEEEARQAVLAAQKSEEAIMKKNAELKAKVLYGARNFEEKYGYTKADFLTLCQCIDNRTAFYGMTVEEVVEQPEQWVGYYATNPVVDKYYKIALESEQAKQNRETKPTSADYVYAYYTDRGIYLSNKYGDDRGFGMWRHE